MRESKPTRSKFCGCIHQQGFQNVLYNWQLFKFTRWQNLNKYNDAMICYDKAIEIDPKYVVGYINKGNFLRFLKKYNVAINSYDKAIEIDPNYTVAYIYKGSSLDDLQQSKDSIICYDKAIEIDSNYVVAYIYQSFNFRYIIIINPCRFMNNIIYQSTVEIVFIEFHQGS